MGAAMEFLVMSSQRNSKKPLRRAGSKRTPKSTPKPHPRPAQQKTVRKPRKAPAPPAASKIRRATPVQTPMFAKHGSVKVSGSTINAPVSTGTSMHHTEPVMTPLPFGQRVSHAELIGDMPSYVDKFATVIYAINPGLAATFPWLSTLAAKYQQYRFRKLRAWFITRCSTDTAGSIMIAPGYVPSNGDPKSETELAAYEGATEGVAWGNMFTDLLPQLMHTTGAANFVRTGYVASALDLFDVAKLFFASVGFAAEAITGKLWLEYEVDLLTPTIRSDVGVYPLASFKARSPELATSKTPMDGSPHNALTPTPSDPSGSNMDPTVNFNALGIQEFLDAEGHVAGYTVVDEGYYAIQWTIRVPFILDGNGVLIPQSYRGIAYPEYNGQWYDGDTVSWSVNTGTRSAPIFTITPANTVQGRSLRYLDAGTLVTLVITLNTSDDSAGLVRVAMLDRFELDLRKVDTGGLSPDPRAAPVPYVLSTDTPVMPPVPRSRETEMPAWAGDGSSLRPARPVAESKIEARERKELTPPALHRHEPGRGLADP